MDYNRGSRFEELLSGISTSDYPSYSQPHSQYQYQQSQQERYPKNYNQQYRPQQPRKRHAWPWILIILFLLVSGLSNVNRISDMMTQFVNPRPTTIQEVRAYNLQPEEYSTFNVEVSDTSVPVIVEQPLPEPEPVEPVVEPIVDNNITGYYRGFMNDAQKAAYDAIYTAISDMTEDAMIPEGVKSSELEFIIDSVRSDHPEIFWVDDYYRYYTYGDDLVSVSFGYTVVPEERDHFFEAINAEADRIIAEAAGLPNEYEKVRYYYESLANLSTYNCDLDNITTQTIVGPFIQHVTACAGYSRAMQYLCERSGIACIYVLGESKGGEEIPAGPHAWNSIVIDGVSCYVDVTWGDLDSPDNMFTYAFLGLTTADIQAIGHTFKYPHLMQPNDNPILERWLLDGTALGEYEMTSTCSLIVDKFSQGYSTIYLRFANRDSLDRFWVDFTGDDSPGAHEVLSQVPWLIGDRGYYAHNVYRFDDLNVAVYSKAF